MPATIVIDQAKRVVYSAFHGEVSEREFLEHGARIESQPSFDPITRKSSISAG